MKTTVVALLVLFSCMLRAQAPEPARLPGEPHHHLKIDNAYVRAYYVEVPPHEVTELHQHDYDYLFVSLGDSDVINAVRDKPEVHLLLKDGETHFTRGSFAHVARNLAATPFRNITIELLGPQENPENLCAEVLANAQIGVCPKTPGAYRTGPEASAVPQFHTAALYLNLVSLDAAMRGAKISVPEKSLLVALKDSEVQIDVQGGPSKTLRGGEMVWIDEHSGGATSNPGKKPSSYLQLTFQDSHRNTKP